MHPDAARLIETLGLKPHPEGGYYVETYRSGKIVESDFRTRDALTSIYYLLPGDTFSAFHRVGSDEIWHHYRGAPVTIEVIDVGGNHRSVRIGDGVDWQFAVPAGVWFAAYVSDANEYALVGCDVAPGFDFSDFELAGRERMLEEFPEHAAVIDRFTRVD